MVQLNLFKTTETTYLKHKRLLCVPIELKTILLIGAPASIHKFNLVLIKAGGQKFHCIF